MFVTPKYGSKVKGIVRSNLMIRVADEYQSATHSPTDPAVADAYESFICEVMEQFAMMIADGIEVIFVDYDPYPDSSTMLADIHDNHRLFVYRGGSLPTDHPLGGLCFTFQETFNSLFRAVHDYYGHYRARSGFGEIGETLAYVSHCELFSPDARRALFTETVGQNAFVNYGPHMRNDDGTMIPTDDWRYLTPANRPFADQKATLLSPGLETAVYQHGRPYLALHRSACAVADARRVASLT